MSNTNVCNCLNDLSLMSKELKQKLNIVGANLTEEEKDRLSIKKINIRDFWGVIEKIFRMDKEINSIIYDLYGTRKLKILQNMSHEIISEENFSNYCTVFYNLYNIILYVEILKYNIENNENETNNNKISLMTGFIIGTITRISDILPNLCISIFSNKIYDVCKKYFEEKY